ncbi:alpha/beta hydrolase-fold protein [Micromonospora sp. WMMC250]|uniref:alpha/beta hydrolase-fold protein n=1 Tax=Micromonospora sp. WMMC250 TaxID=3014781 RepID=UPI0022B60D94|nr:alpha/beta hydrolase-fold protein [Micromonospora sp. WMMC250]MCZ7375106.1 alpha/beta hydrolase-fold protein [Micromonospora sp. WMMC250]
MSVATPRPPTSSPRRRLAIALLAAVTVAAGTVAVPAASAAPPTPMGPTVIRTDKPPTGYAVTFRYRAPDDVQQVHVYGDWFFSRPENIPCQDCGDARPPTEWQPGDVAATPWHILPMRKGPDGVWTFTTPLPAGTFRYAFTHDCANELGTGCTLYDDPANRWQIQPQYPGAPGAVRSTIYVPTSRKFPTYDTAYQAPVARIGRLESRRYTSPLSTNPAGAHDIVVYTPHGYDPDRAEPYPTLYLSHGSGDHSTAWTMQGVAHLILENAIKDRAAQPMVIVSTDFNGLPGGNEGYVDELRNNIFPFVEQNYHVSTRAQDRAFGGFSAGGSRAYTIMYNHTDLFGYHAAWSAGGPAATPEQIDGMRAVAGGIMIGTGLQDRLGNIAENSQRNAAALRAAGVALDEYNVPGVHTWHVWRPLLNHYLRTLAFRATTTGLDVSAAPVGGSRHTGVTATATVGAVSTGAAAPSGTVEFSAGDRRLGSARVHNGVARLKTILHGDLDAPVVARYHGDKLFNGSHSSPVDAR